MARRALVRRINLELSADELPEYRPETVDALVDWICQAENFEEQDERIQTVLDGLRTADATD